MGIKFLYSFLSDYFGDYFEYKDKLVESKTKTNVEL